MEWFYVHDGQSIGPVSEEALKELVQNGFIKPETQLWNHSFGQKWKPASEVPELSSVSLAEGLASDTSNGTVMALARQSLSGNWWLFVGIQFLLEIARGMFKNIGKLGNLLLSFSSSAALLVMLVGLCISFAWVIVRVPIAYGVQIMYLKASRGTTVFFNNVFDGFQAFGRAWCTTLWIMLFMSLWWLLIIIPAVFMAEPMASAFSKATFSNGWSGMSEMSALLWALRFLIVMAIVSLPAFIAWLSYSMSYFVLHDNPHMRARDAVRRSAFIMYGYRLKLSYLYLRFTGWFLLCLLTCGIGFLWLQPYIQMSKAQFYRTIKHRP